MSKSDLKEPTKNLKATLEWLDKIIKEVEPRPVIDHPSLDIYFRIKNRLDSLRRESDTI